MKKVLSKSSHLFEKSAIIILLFFGLIGCKNIKTEIDISDYYFPLTPEGNTVISEYITIKSGRDTQQMTWHYNFIGVDTLVATGFNQNGQIVQERSEHIISNGVELTALTAYMPDTTGNYYPSEAGIVYDDVFPYFVKPEAGVFLYKIELPDPILDGVVRTITRNRRYLRDTSVIFHGSAVDGVVFDYKESIEDIREGRLTLDFYGQEIYLKGIGLYERIRNYEGSLYDIVRLKKMEKEFSQVR